MDARLRWVATLAGVVALLLALGCGVRIPVPLDIPVTNLNIPSFNPGGVLDTYTGRADGYVYVPSSTRQAAVPQIGDSLPPPEGFVPAEGALVTLVSVAPAGVGALQQPTTVTDVNGYFFFDNQPIDAEVTVEVSLGGQVILSGAVRTVRQFSTAGFRAVRVDLSIIDQYRNNLAQIQSIDSVQLSGDFTNSGNSLVRVQIYSSDRADLASDTIGQSADAARHYDISVEPNTTRSVQRLDADNLAQFQSEVTGGTDQQFFLYFVTDPSDVPVSIADFRLDMRATLGVGL